MFLIKICKISNLNSSDEQIDSNDDISSITLENTIAIPYRSDVVAAPERDNAYTTTPHVNNHDRGTTTAEGNKNVSPSSFNPNVSSNVMIVNESVPLMNGDNRSVMKLSEQQSDIKRTTMETVTNNTASTTVGGGDCKNSKPSKSRSVTSGGGGGGDVSGDKNKISPVVKEKKHKGGFLSRLSGFRFSLRGKKKPKVFENNNPVINEQAQQQPQQRVTSVVSGSNNKHDKNVKVEKSDSRPIGSVNKNGDFVIIPLKEPPSIPSTPTTANQSIRSDDSVRSKQTSEDAVNNTHVLTAKPPLPRQPPRVVGLCAKPPLPSGKPRPIHAQQRASSAPREIDVNDHQLSSDHEFYNQFCETMTSCGDDSGNCDDDRFNESYGFEHKIGLIETNLDTHETVISGKTRSLMELGPQIDSHQRKQSHAKHRISTTMEPQTRRPHKSMEFLLDKENQKFVLVSTVYLIRKHLSSLCSLLLYLSEILFYPFHNITP